MSRKLRLTIGLSIVPEDAPGFADHGLTYYGLSKLDATRIEDLFNSHKAEILAGMDGLIDDLVKVGYADAAEESENRGKSPGTMR